MEDAAAGRTINKEINQDGPRTNRMRVDREALRRIFDGHVAGVGLTINERVINEARLEFTNLTLTLSCNRMCTVVDELAPAAHLAVYRHVACLHELPGAGMNESHEKQGECKGCVVPIQQASPIQHASHTNVKSRHGSKTE